MTPEIAERYLRPLFGAVDVIALAMMIGIAASLAWLARTSTGVQELRWRGWFAAALALATIAAIGDLLASTAVIADVNLAEVPAEIPLVVFETRFGTLWLWRAAALIGLWLAWLWSWRATAAHWLIAPGTLMLAYLVGSAGHAGEESLFNTATLVNWVHIVSGCIWAGAVMAYARVVFPSLRDAKAPRSEIAQATARLSTAAGGALAVVVASGIYNAWQQIGTVGQLLHSTYGRVLLLKLSFVAAMAAFGAVNRYVFVPAVLAWAERPARVFKPLAPAVSKIKPNAPASFWRMLRLDGWLALAVLALAAVLSLQTPPKHEEPAAASGTFTPA